MNLMIHVTYRNLYEIIDRSQFDRLFMANNAIISREKENNFMISCFIKFFSNFFLKRIVNLNTHHMFFNIIFSMGMIQKSPFDNVLQDL